MVFAVGSLSFIAKALGDKNYVLENIPINQQKILMAGASDDCISLESGCENNPTCTTNDDCTAGQYGCDDTTKEERCQYNGYSFFACVYDPGYYCSPKRLIQGNCGPYGVCVYAPAPYGNCGGDWVYQCHY